jgi:hypothetical protein
LSASSNSARACAFMLRRPQLKLEIPSRSDGRVRRRKTAPRRYQGAGVASGLPFSTTYTPTSLHVSVPVL